MMLKKIYFSLIVLSFLLTANAQIAVPFDTADWKIEAEEFKLTDYRGKKALQLKNGIAYLENAGFKDGIIEWDMAFPGQRGFTGIRFRIEDLSNMEEFYLRPHQSGQPDANQYCPVDNGLSTWQLYHGEEYSATCTYRFDEWFHVKLAVSGTRAEVYIDDMKEPLLHVPFLKRKPVAGGLMVYSAMAPAYFANFSYTPKDDPILINQPVAESEMDPLTIPVWSVSSPFPEKMLEKAFTLGGFQADGLKWQDLKVESSGTANLGTVAVLDREKQNTVFAKVVINASEDQLKALHFGYSDRAKVYCNGTAVYSGDNGYRTRDFRYLGTIGYFDTVYLPLKKGRNEVWVAVSENFGGWGLRGKLEDLEGVDLVY
ncbi:MAG: hypothetical protein H6559_02235 [Lewinellaceae bacterium]|nr:hypothetical protein [Lewinellaceae bacterium]